MVGGTILLSTGVKYIDEELNVSYAAATVVPTAMKGVNDTTLMVVPTVVQEMTHPMLTLTLAHATDLLALMAPIKVNATPPSGGVTGGMMGKNQKTKNEKGGVTTGARQITQVRIVCRGEG